MARQNGDTHQESYVPTTIKAAQLAQLKAKRDTTIIGSTVSGKKVEVDDPWGFGGSLEWATSCPPPRHNFTALPRIRSERPALDLHHPELSTNHDVAAAALASQKGE